MGVLSSQRMAKSIATQASARPLGLRPALLPGASRSRLVSALLGGGSAVPALRNGAAAALRRAPAGRPLGVRTIAAAAAPAAQQQAVDIPETAHGFTLQRHQFVKEYDSHVCLYKHEKTGAELISVINGDENKTFGAVFRTPVGDSTGIPHILEHSVLCGSRKYPIKEPFVELMKGSLNTFLNAFTYPDRTCYPVASTNTQDFYNLVDVYLDAVLYPNCVADRQTFQQEGWHLELDNP